MHGLFLYCCTLQLVLKFRSSTHTPSTRLHPSPRNYHAFRQWEWINRELISPRLLYTCDWLSAVRECTPETVCVCVAVCRCVCVCAHTSPHFLITFQWLTQTERERVVWDGAREEEEERGVDWEKFHYEIENEDSISPHLKTNVTLLLSNPLPPLSLSPSLSLSGGFAWIDMIYSELQWEHNDVRGNELISI